MEVIKDISWSMSSNDLQVVKRWSEVVQALSGVVQTCLGQNKSELLLINV